MDRGLLVSLVSAGIALALVAAALWLKGRPDERPSPGDEHERRE